MGRSAAARKAHPAHCPARPALIPLLPHPLLVPRRRPPKSASVASVGRGRSAADAELADAAASVPLSAAEPAASMLSVPGRSVSAPAVSAAASSNPSALSDPLTAAAVRLTALVESASEWASDEAEALRAASLVLSRCTASPDMRGGPGRKPRRARATNFRDDSERGLWLMLMHQLITDLNTECNF